MPGVFQALAVAAAFGSCSAVDESKERPVMKIVRLLQDMGAELQRDLDDDKAVHEQLDCWCKTNDRDKSAAIEIGDAKVSELESFMGEAAAKMRGLKTSRDSTLDEVNKDEASLQEASTLRMKGNKASHAETSDLMEAIKACDQALVVLGGHQAGPGLAQLRTVAKSLQGAQVLELGRHALGTADMLILRNFLMKSQGATSFLAIPGFQSHGSQSGRIQGVLAQMKEDFEKDLSEAEAKEKEEAEEYASLKAAKEQEIQSGRKLVFELDQQVAELKEKHAEAFKELEDTQGQLELDRTFLANLKQKCSASDAEFDQRVKDRLTEIAAIQDTVKILNDDQAFDAFDKTVNSFVQLASSNGAKESLHRATSVLMQAAFATGAPELSLLASRAQLDAFTKVKEEIDKMVVQLKRQQQEEAQHRDWCISELNENKRDTEAADDSKDKLQNDIADHSKSIDYLSKEIETATAAIAEMQKQMKRASENREAENADYQQTVTDQRTVQMILEKALKRMKEVYAFVQQQPGAPHIETSGTHTDPGNGPARFTKYEQHAGGSKVVQLLDEVLADSRKTEDEAISSEQDAQGAYENLMKDSNKAIAVYSKKISNMNGARAGRREDLTMAREDLKATVGKLGELNDTNGNLHKSCDFIVNTFDDRQAARTAEIDALAEAKAILSGTQ